MDFFALLGVTPGAPAAEVNSAFRKKSLIYHPDRCPNDPLAAERFQQLTAARDFLRTVAGHTEVAAAAAVVPPRRQQSGAGSPQSASFKVTRGWHWCEKCRLRFTSRNALTAHIHRKHFTSTSAHFVKGNTCPACGKKFADHTSARRHLDRSRCRAKAERGELRPLKRASAPSRRRRKAEELRPERERPEAKVTKTKSRAEGPAAKRKSAPPRAKAAGFRVNQKEKRAKPLRPDEEEREKRRRQQGARAERLKRLRLVEERREQRRRQASACSEREEEKQQPERQPERQGGGATEASAKASQLPKEKQQPERQPERQGGGATEASAKWAEQQKEAEEVLEEGEAMEEVENDEMVDGYDIAEEELQEEAQRKEEQGKEEVEGKEEASGSAEEGGTKACEEDRAQPTLDEEEEVEEDESIEDPEEEAEADDYEVFEAEDMPDEEVALGASDGSNASVEQSPARKDPAGAFTSPRTSPRPRWRNLSREGVLPGKQRKHSSLSERLAKVLEIESCGPLEVNSCARGMLARMVRTLGPQAFEAGSGSSFTWHPHETRVLAMVEETLVTVRAAASRAAASATSKAEAAAADVEKAERLAAAVAAAEKETAAQELDVSKCGKALARRQRTLDEATAAAKEAVAEIRAVAQREASCTQKKRQAADILKKFSVMEATGKPKACNIERGRLYKEVERGLQAAKLSETLAASHHHLVMPALKTEPAKRSRESEAALSCAEGCLKDHLQELVAQAAEVGRDWARAKECERRARLAVATYTDELQQASDTLQAAQDELRLCNVALEAARTAQRQHESNIREFAEAAREWEAQLAEVDSVLSAIQPLSLCPIGGS